jgi:predicted RNase H-like HicB family nuclease
MTCATCRTVDECRARAVEAIETHIPGLLSDGEPVPEEVDEAQLLAVTVAA